MEDGGKLRQLLGLLKNIYFCVFVHVCVGEYRVHDTWVESVLSYYVGPRGHTHVSRLSGKCLYY